MSTLFLNLNRIKQMRLGCKLLPLLAISIIPFISAISQEWKVVFDSARACYTRGDCPAGLEKAKLAIDLYENNISQHDTTYAEMLSNLARGYHCLTTKDTSYRDTVIQLYSEAIGLREQFCGRLDSVVQEYILSKVGSLNHYGRLDEAINLTNDLLSRSENNFQTESHFIFEAYYWLGGLYLRKGQFEKAENAFREAEVFAAKYISLFKSDYADLCWKIGDLYSEQTRFSEAEGYQRRAIQHIKKYINSTSQEGLYLTYLGEAVMGQGRYAEAEELFFQAVELYKKNPDDYNRLITTFGDLGALYLYIGKLSAAEKYLKRSLAIMEETNQDRGGYSAEYARRKLHLGAIYLAQNKISEAELAIRWGFTAWKYNYDSTHHYLARAYNYMARLWYALGKIDSAEYAWREAIAISERAFKNDNPFVAKYLINLATLLDHQGRSAEAEPLLKRANKILLKNIYDNFPSLGEAERKQFYELSAEFFERYNSFLLERSKDNPSTIFDMLHNQLATKALLLKSSNAVRRNIENSHDSTLISSYRFWLQARNALSKIVSLPESQIKEQRINLDSLEQISNELDRFLTKESKVFSQDRSPLLISISEIQKRLNDTTAAVNMIRFRLYKNRWTDTVYYAAIIVRAGKNAIPELVLLKNGKELETQIFDLYRRTITPTLQSDSSFNPKKYFQLLSSNLVKLFTQYWEPIQKKLNGVSTVYFIPDGIYYKVNLNTLSPKANSFLVDNIDVRLNTSLTDLIEPRTNPDEKNIIPSAVIIARPNFDLDCTKTQENNIYKTTSGESDRRTPSNHRLGPWMDLKRSESEGRKIRNLFEQKRWKSVLIVGDSATEDAVKNVESPTVLHLATHGYFLKDQQSKNDELNIRADNRMTENPLLKSGLIFAGANRFIKAMKEKNYDALYMDDDNGILTASEAANLRLDHTQLVVLSACETGLGKIQNGEGVYGLQRAFLLAGARAVMMSLWSVEEGATEKLMGLFYENLMKCNDMHRALRHAEQEMIRNGYFPADWGAFVIMGGE